MNPVRVAFRSMATRFEFVLPGSDAPSLRAAAEEAMREVMRIEERCNFYSPASELSRLNREAAVTNVPCSGMMMRLLTTCRDLHRATQGRFDPTVAPALAAWGLRHQGDAGRIPSGQVLEDVQNRIGMQHVDIDEHHRCVRFTKEGIQLDLGGIAKGWALDEARLILEESGIDSALLHGGTSTAVAMGTDPEDVAWKIGIEDPYAAMHEASGMTSEEPVWLLAIPLSSAALSVSAVHGKSFVNEEGSKRTEYGHVIDPLTSRAVSGPRLSVAVAESATACDAWSTAMLAAPSEPVPGHILGTAFLKTDSGWTVTAGTIHPSWTSPASSPPFPTPPAD